MQLNISVNIPFAVGELIDKVTILEIKIEHFQDPHPRYGVIDEESFKKKTDYCIKEYNMLSTLIASFESNEKVKELREKIKTVNRKLWDIESKLRVKEIEQDFGEDFIELARNVYKTNDERGALKNEINEMTGSDIREQKDYTLETGWPEEEPKGE